MWLTNNHAILQNLLTVMQKFWYNVYLTENRRFIYVKLTINRLYWIGFLHDMKNHQGFSFDCAINRATYHAQPHLMIAEKILTARGTRSYPIHPNQRFVWNVLELRHCTTEVYSWETSTNFRFLKLFKLPQNFVVIELNHH